VSGAVPPSVLLRPTQRACADAPALRRMYKSAMPAAQRTVDGARRPAAASHDAEVSAHPSADATPARWTPPAGGAGGVTGAFARFVARRIPVGHLEERDVEYIRRTLPGLWMLSSFYFRADVRGLHHIPADGPVLLVGNHSGGNVPPDTFVFTFAFSAYFGAERPFYQLAHNLVMAMPALGFLRRYGTVAATPENTDRALRAGAAVLVYPGGDHETHRPSWESRRIDFDGRKGFIAQALEHRVPIVPVVSIGGQESALFLSRGAWLAHALRLDRMFRLHVLPISIAPPWGLNVGDMLGHVPLPAKITVQVLPPIDLREVFGPTPDLDQAYEHVVGVMQRALDDLAADRRLPIIG